MMGCTDKYEESPDVRQHAEAQAGKRTDRCKALRGTNGTTHERKESPEFSRAQIEAAKRRIARYEEWRRHNAQAYAYAEALALREAENGRRVSGSWLVSQIRTKDIVDDRGKTCRPNNDHAPLMVREIISEHPEVAPFVERRTNVYERLLNGDGEAA